MTKLQAIAGCYELRPSLSPRKVEKCQLPSQLRCGEWSVLPVGMGRVRYICMNLPDLDVVQVWEIREEMR